MKRSRRLQSVLLALLVSNGAATAQEPHQHRHDESEQFGQVHFRTSCGPTAQRQFTRALALLHSFQYVEAEQAFAEIAGSETQCSMAHWGVAMSNYHPLWTPPTPAELKKGGEAVEKAKGA